MKLRDDAHRVLFALRGAITTAAATTIAPHLITCIRRCSHTGNQTPAPDPLGPDGEVEGEIDAVEGRRAAIRAVDALLHLVTNDPLGQSIDAIVDYLDMITDTLRSWPSDGSASLG